MSLERLERVIDYLISLDKVKSLDSLSNEEIKELLLKTGISRKSNFNKASSRLGELVK